MLSNAQNPWKFVPGSVHVKRGEVMRIILVPGIGGMLWITPEIRDVSVAQILRIATVLSIVGITLCAPVAQHPVLIL